MAYHGDVKRAPPTQADPADPLAFRAAREVCRRHAKGLYFASAFLPQPKRDAAHAAYAFCRMIRDAIDSTDEEPGAGAAQMRHRPLSAVQSSAIAMGGLAGDSAAGPCCSTSSLDQRLSLLRDRLNDLYDGRLELPSPPARSQEQHLLHAFAATVQRYQIPRQYFLDLSDGCRIDLAVSRYATWASLERYCRRAGGAAALIASAVFGVTHPYATVHAVQGGSAIRLTEILRDLKADVASGRIYLPLEDLAAFRYSERDLAGGVVNERFRDLMQFQIARARRLYAEAAEGLCRIAGDGSRLTAATILAWQSGILDAIERQGCDVFSRRPVLSGSRKLRRLPLAWRLARRRPDARLPAFVRTPDAAPLAAAR